MTDIECKEQRERIEKYDKYSNTIAVILGRKNAIQNGIISMLCENNRIIDFNYLGEDFNKRLIENICSFLDSEIENIKKEMEKI